MQREWGMLTNFFVSELIGVVEHPQLQPCVEGRPGGRAKGGSYVEYRMSILDIWVGFDSLPKLVLPVWTSSRDRF